VKYKREVDYMSIELTTAETGVVEIIYDNFAEQGIDCDIAMPDYCPDIMRILKCSVTNSITNSKISGDRATVDGNAKIRIIYTDEKNGIYSYEQDYPFSKFAELTSSYEGAMLCAEAKTEYANCRAVGKKRIDIHGVISIRFRILGIKKESVIIGADGDGIQLKKFDVGTDSAAAVILKKFQLSQTEETNNGDIGKILFASASPVLSETKVIKGKILLKGEAVMRVVYCAEGSENKCVCVNYNLPFSEIAEAENVTEDCKINVEFTVDQVQAEPKTDNDGEYKYLNIGCDICALITAYKPETLSVITDAYSTEKEIDAKYKTTTFSQILQNINDSFVCRESIDLSSMEPQRIYTVMAENPDAKISFDNEKMTVKGSIPLKFILIDGSGAPVFCEREAEFEYSRSVDSRSSSLHCNSQLCLTGYTCTLTGDGRAEFKAEVNISADVTESCECRTLISLKAVENSDLKKRHSSLVICFCDGGEKVWDIARKYNTTVEEIISENDLGSDEISEKMMLVIPVK
jgi:hypothetical protein